MNRLPEVLKKAKNLSTQAKSIQETIDKTANTISELKLESAEFGKSETATLKGIREDLLADVHLGEASPDQLKNLDSKIRDSEFVDSQRQDTVATINGLARKLEAAEQDARLIAGQIVQNSQAYLNIEAEIVGAEYITAAQEVCRLFRQLRSLSELSNSPFCYGGVHSKMFIPAFMLESHAGLDAGVGNPTILSNALDISSDAGNLAQQDAEAERNRLAGLGVVL